MRIHILLAVLFIISLSAQAHAEGSAVVSVTSTERAVDDRRLDMEATLEMASMVFKARSEFEGVRVGIEKRLAHGDYADHARADLCLRCTPDPQWGALPIGPLAPLRIEKAQCAKEPATDCVTEEEFQRLVNEVLSTPLSSLERVSCRYLSGVLGVNAECPTRVGGFYACERLCE